MKLKNKLQIFFILFVLILLSSCNQEEGKFVLSQYNFSNNQKFEILDKTSGEESSNTIISSSDFNKAVLVSSNSSLSYGASFTEDSVKISQMKISNDLFNWTFSPTQFEDESTLYFGAKNLIIPNYKMLGDFLNCEIFLEDGSIITDSILAPSESIQPIELNLLILNNMILITHSAKNIDGLIDSNVDFYDVDKIDKSKIINLDLLDAVDDSSFSIRFYKDNKLLSDKEFNLALNNDYELFSSSYLKKCDNLLLSKKISNTTISSNLYTIK